MASERFKNALAGIQQKIPPIWMMRQAGRYHKHYRALREKYSFMELCKVPELAAEVAFGPVEEFDFDVSILFSDLLFPLEALGMGLTYEDSGPKLGFSLTEENFSKLKSTDDAIGDLMFQKEAVRLTRERIPKEKSVIGFVGGAWTLYTYASDGRHEGSLIQPKKNIALRIKFFEKIIDLLKKNIQLQLDGGAEIAMVFDTSAGELSLLDFREIVMPYIREIAKSFPKKIGYYSRGTGRDQFDEIATVPELAGIGFDHRVDLAKVFRTGKKSGFVQGNFDQTLLFLEKNDFEKAFSKFLSTVKDCSPAERAGWVCGLGHGVLPKTPEENVKRFVEVVRECFGK